MAREYRIDGKDFIVYAPIRYSMQDIDDLMSTALEGGVNYWCRRAEVNETEYYGEYASDQISRGGSLTLYDAESEDNWVLDLDKLIHGLCLALADKHGMSADPDDWDADTADIVIQYALFNDIVFG